MIQFTLSLTVNQIACLRAVALYEDGVTDSLGRGISHFWTGCRLLFAEKLIEHTRRPATEADKKKHGCTKEVDVWRITEKGRLVLRLIEMEVTDYANSITERERTIINSLQAGGETS